MTKAEEIAVLEKAIAKLGPDSYLGPWLTQVRSEVESSIRSDFFPDVTLKESAAVASRIKQQAVVEAADIVAKAQKEAGAIKIAADNHRDRLMGNIREALRALERW